MDSARPSSVLRPARDPLVAAGIVTAISAVAGMAPPLAVVEVSRRLMSGRTDVWPIVVLALVALAVRQLGTFGAGVLTHLADIRVSFGIRRDLLRKMRRLPLGWFTDRNSGTVKKTVEDDVAALHQLIAHSIVELTAAIVPPVFALVYLFVVDWRLALVTAAVLGTGLLVYQRAMAGAGAKYPQFMEWLARLNAAAVEFVNGIGVVKAYGRPGVASRRFQDVSLNFARFFLDWARSTTRASILSEIVLSPPSMLLVLAAGGAVMVAAGALPATTLIAFLVFGVICTSGAMTVMMSIHPLVTAVNVARSIADVMATPELPAPRRTVPVGQEHQGPAVAFRSVGYAYGETVALRDVSAELRPGTVTALVGPSGSGKSTLARLLPRFDDPLSGSVEIHGTDLRDIDPSELYRYVAFVFQDAALLRMTVRENIRLGRPDAGDDEVRHAAAQAQILDRLDRLPRGLDAMVGEDAVFSGGEAQRICIARALLADRPILVLDEATASADPENEARIQDALSAVARERTVLVIAHRLSTITNADQIIVLDDGRVAERGRHAELVAHGGLYARMWAADQRAHDGRQDAEVPR